MSRIAGLIPRNNKGTPRLDAIMITRLLGTKQIVRDGFFFTENQQASAKFGSIQIVIDCSIFNADDFSTPQKKLTDAQRVLLSISKIGIVRTLEKINGRFCLAVFDTKTNELIDIESDKIQLKDIPNPPKGKSIKDIDVVINVENDSQ